MGTDMIMEKATQHIYFLKRHKTQYIYPNAEGHLVKRHKR